MVYGNIESGGRLGPFQDISSICRAAIVSGVGTNEAPFYVTFTIVEPVAEYQDPGGGRVVFDKWDLATDPVRSKPPYVSDTCCRGGWPPRLGAETNAVLKYQKMYGEEWENVRAFQIEEVEEHLCPIGMYIVSETENGHTFVHCLPCAAGTYKASWGTSPCLPCPESTSSKSGASSCDAESPASTPAEKRAPAITRLSAAVARPLTPPAFGSTWSRTSAQARAGGAKDGAGTPPVQKGFYRVALPPSARPGEEMVVKVPRGGGGQEQAVSFTVPAHAQSAVDIALPWMSPSVEAHQAQLAAGTVALPALQEPLRFARADEDAGRHQVAAETLGDLVKDEVQAEGVPQGAGHAAQTALAAVGRAGEWISGLWVPGLVLDREARVGPAKMDGEDRGQAAPGSP